MHFALAIGARRCDAIGVGGEPEQLRSGRRIAARLLRVVIRGGHHAGCGCAAAGGRRVVEASRILRETGGRQRAHERRRRGLSAQSERRGHSAGTRERSRAIRAQ